MADNVKWTPEQEAAINFRGGNAIVSAAAGSGKTAVLVERVKRIVLDRDDPVKADEMVISTFTVDAAAEIKARLDKAISEELSKAPDDRYLTEQRLRLQDACISTISSFCLNILRRNSALAGLQPGFSVLDEAETKLIYSGALDDVLEELCESGDPAEREMLYEWFAGEDDERLKNAINTLYDFSRRIPDPEGYFRSQLAMYGDPDNVPPRTAEMQEKYFVRNVLGTAERFCDVFSEVEELTRGTGAEKYADKWRELRDTAAEMTDDTSCTAVYESGRLSASVPRKASRIKDFDCSVLDEPHAELKELWGRLAKHAGLWTRRKADMRACGPVLRSLVSLTGRLDEIFAAKKAEKNRIDLGDIELLTLRLLRGSDGTPSDAAKEIARGISVIIVDEFQDSNEIQYEIFRLIADAKRACGGECSLYCVGDIKQSIYRFRGADPLVFSRLTKDPSFTVIDLNRNFRSCGQVIDSVNGIFTGTMTEELGDVTYDDTCALVQGASYDTDDNNRTELITFTGGNMAANRRSEAEYLADRVKSMVTEGFEISDGGAKRPCGYGDIAVLMGRYSGSIDIYKAVFAEAGIPFDAKENEEYTDFADVRHAMSLLRVIDDPYRDTDLAAVLMREPYMLSERDMADIKIAAGRGGRLWTGLRKYAGTNARAAAILDEIEGYRRFSEENSAERLIRRICDESLLIPAAEASPDGAKRSFDLHKLIYYAEMFSGGESASLYDFIKYMESIKKGKIKLAQPKGESRGAVRFMTIHGSKGLEFPVCFVANVTSRPSRSYDEIICDPSCGIGMKISDTANGIKISTLPYDIAAAENDRLELSEEMRLLYVAATRAKEKLIFTVPLSKTEPDMHYGWIIGSRAVNGNEPLIDVYEKTNYRSSAERLRSEPEYIPAVIPEFSGYRYRIFSAVPAKVTATQIGVKSVDDYAEQSDRIERFLRVPSFIGTRETSRLTGKKRGDAYHKVMELLDFSASREDVPRLLDEMHENGKLSDIERASVSEDDISAFLESDICRRAAKSGTIHREFPIFCEYTPEAGEWGADDWKGEEKPFIQGIADMFFIEDGEIVLVDYKTNSHVTAEILTEEYRGQLDVYAGALSEATGMRVKQKLLYSFEIGEIEVD